MALYIVTYKTKFGDDSNSKALTDDWREPNIVLDKHSKIPTASKLGFLFAQKNTPSTVRMLEK